MRSNWAVGGLILIQLGVKTLLFLISNKTIFDSFLTPLLDLISIIIAKEITPH